MFIYDVNWVFGMAIVKNFFRMILNWFKPKPKSIEIINLKDVQKEIRDE
mgnify:FL=1